MASKKPVEQVKSKPLNAQAIFKRSRDRELTDHEFLRAQEIIGEFQVGRVTDLQQSIIDKLQKILEIHSEKQPPLLTPLTSVPAAPDSITAISATPKRKRVLANNPIDEAIDFRDTMARMKVKQTHICSTRKKSPRYVSERLALLQLPEAIQTQLRTGELKPNGNAVKAALAALREQKENEVEIFNLPSLSIDSVTAISLCKILHALDSTIPIIDFQSDAGTIKSILQDHANTILGQVVATEKEGVEDKDA